MELGPKGASSKTCQCHLVSKIGGSGSQMVYRAVDIVSQVQQEAAERCDDISLGHLSMGGGNQTLLVSSSHSALPQLVVYFRTLSQG